MNYSFKENQKKNLEIIRCIYIGLSSSNITPLLKFLNENVVWIEATGFPYGGTYRGITAVQDVFERLATEWNDFKSNVTIYHEIIGRKIIIVEGFYSGVCKNTEKSFKADFVHIWTLEDGMIQKFKQYVDSYVVREAMKP
ncbi:nuclear transport factor 2 family protein [Bacillus toyonensis]|uniref:nuclear transport factor 2 family protein n=1 Tax=Bacillus toyonensis TaxID=155322 RepID=UPI000BF10107|nr:nuclear transport factor 2 family protein [Bacillus toyonensis]PEK69140.1 DUF4440 domain-containing protein [Bacillus toyonensis]PEO54540.1 DUF4440 domain-containing protein [Bacillus toyonensis]PFY32665.1 DUF4440 domain-containing protein [Bacillus toyonensis]PFY55413.1 DUF4440 domain-containing protein [Bacillus toyonensis]PGC97086.1 DUF4440 domain-containing protein [Bacillus toyonensis]